jgi:hypothetical protein
LVGTIWFKVQTKYLEWLMLLTTPLTKLEQKQTEEDRYVGPGSDRHKQVAGLN